MRAPVISGSSRLCADGRCRPPQHSSLIRRWLELQIGTSAFRLIDRARVPTNLRISRSGPHQVSHFNPTTTAVDKPLPPTFFSSDPSSPAANMSDSTVGKTKQFGKGQRTVPHHTQKAQKWYPVDDEPQPKKVSTILAENEKEEEDRDATAIICAIIAPA